MKKILFLIVFSVTINGYSQFLITMDPLPQGMIQKNQLWNLNVFNNTSSLQQLQIELVVADFKTNAPVFTVSTKPTQIPPGSHHMNATELAAVNYLMLNIDYRIDNNPYGLMPIGDFKLTYSFYVLQGDFKNKVGQETSRLQIPPASPPVLQNPFDKSTSDIKEPLFTWLPPSPLSLLNNLRYDIKICELYQGQTVFDAILNNPPILSSSEILNTTFNYPPSAKPLSAGKSFVWQITAKQGMSEFAKSEIWSFKTSIPNVTKQRIAPFVKLKKTAEENYTAFFKDLRFEYINETTDSVWKTLCEDVTSGKHNSFVLDFKMPLKKGSNLIIYPASDDNRFSNDHIYVLKILNSRKELWQVKFQYKNQ